MESLTRNNYEMWFLDYLDGQLNNEQLETLLDFVEQHPDLKEELLGVSGISLAPDLISFGHKEVLLKNSDDIPGISANDQLCIARMENDLIPEKAQLFDARLAENSGLSETYSAFQNTRLNPADQVTYPDKQDLRKKTVFFTPWLITAISAAAVILLGWILWPNSTEKEVPGLVMAETPAVINPQPGASRPQLAARILIPETRDTRREMHHPSPVTPDPVNIHSAVIANLSRDFSPMNPLSHKALSVDARMPDARNRKVLYASNYLPAISNPVSEEDALTIPQFALQLFREKILGRKREQVRETQFSIWEVAGAGVDKINSLTGTNMKLNCQYDSQGDILAVSFNSRLIDVESPVRSQESR